MYEQPDAVAMYSVEQIVAFVCLLIYLASVWVLIYKQMHSAEIQTEILNKIGKYLTKHGQNVEKIHAWVKPVPAGDQSLYMKLAGLCTGFRDKMSEINNRLTGIESALGTKASKPRKD